MTREHAFPNWILKLLPGEKAGTQFHLSGKLPKLLRAWGTRDQTGVTVKPVCRECNEGWMSQLEDRAKPILAPMMLGTPHDLSAEEKAIVISWTLKTWMVFDANTKQHERLFSADERKYLMDTLRPHAALNLIVFLDHYLGPREMYADHYGFGISPKPQPADVDVRNLNRFYCQTMVLGQVTTQATVRRIVSDETDFPVIGRSWLDADLDLTWTGSGNHWPPAAAIDEQRFQDFRDRWLSDDHRNMVRRP